jgi:L-alanine-DL-glutamate epimerase-like enolase superfamily enzyme
MTIRDVQLVELLGHHDDSEWRSAGRLVRPLDVYAEFRDPAPPSRPASSDEPLAIRHTFVEIHTDHGVGRYGPILSEQAYLIHTRLRPFLVGRDARPMAKLWDQMARSDRHARSGHYMLAISAVDCALWDLKGKALGEPVYRLLGGPTRDELPVYASMLGHSLEPDALAADP